MTSQAVELSGQSKILPVIHYASTLTGHTPYFPDDTPEGRRKLGKHIEAMVIDGLTILVEDGDEVYRIRGYDSDENEWILSRVKSAKPADTSPQPSREEKRDAANTTANVVPQRSGG